MLFDPHPSLYEDFGYTPSDPRYEQWSVYTGGMRPVLCVLHPDRRPRFYKQGCQGHYVEVDPSAF